MSAHSFPHLSFIILHPFFHHHPFITWSPKRSPKYMNQAISHARLTLLNQRILNPANEALHEGCLPASPSQLVPPSCPGTPSLLPGFCTGSSICWSTPPPRPYCLAPFKSFPQSSGLRMNQAPLCPSCASCSCRVSHRLSTGSVNFCLSH